MQVDSNLSQLLYIIKFNQKNKCFKLTNKQRSIWAQADLAYSLSLKLN